MCRRVDIVARTAMDPRVSRTFVSLKFCYKITVEDVHFRQMRQRIHKSKSTGKTLVVMANIHGDE